jgi:hypothetical protein
VVGYLRGEVKHSESIGESTFECENEDALKAAAEIERLRAALKVGDAVAHQLLYRDHGALLDAWWQARGGHELCTVCTATKVYMDAAEAAKAFGAAGPKK